MYKKSDQNISTIFKDFCYQHGCGWIETEMVDGRERRDDMQPTVWLDVCDVLK